MKRLLCWLGIHGPCEMEGAGLHQMWWRCSWCGREGYERD